MIQGEIGLPTAKTKNFQIKNNSDRLRNNLDLLDETPERDHIRMVTYKQRMSKYYNSRVKPKIFHKDSLTS